MMRKTFLTSALDMPEIMSYIYNKSWKLQFSASSSIIIIEDFYLQTFLHSLTDYANTLRSYLMNGWNAVRTANELHIHKSTFFYRLNKMEELFDLDITQEETMVAYEYSFILIEYLRKIKL